MLPSFRDEVEAALAAALASLDFPTGELAIEEPPSDVDAVLASSVAFRLASEAGAPPPAVADDVAAAVDPSGYRYVAAARAAGPYVNFLPSEQYFADALGAAQDEDWGRLDPREESVVVEHTSFNPTGPVHVGRARNTIVGDALANLLEAAGYDVDREYYVNDAGRQMAVFTWAYETFDEAELPPPERERPDYDLVRYYRTGNEFLETADPAAVEEAEAEIEAIMRGLEAGDEEVYERVSTVVDGVLAGVRECLARLPAAFDEFVKETRFVRDGSTDEVVAALKESEHAVYEDDAWQLDLSDWGIDKRFVFLRSDGTTLYTTRDLAHHEWKFAEYDRAITVLGEDQALHADQLRAALEILGHDTDRLVNHFYGWVTLPGGESMSTREGTGVDLDDLLDEAVARAREEVESRLDDRGRDDDLSEADLDRIARQVGVGAVRYDVVSKQSTKAITFEWDRALDFEAQSAPYVQYVHARCCGILDEAGETPASFDAAALDHEAERDLLLTVSRYPAVIEDAAADRKPHAVATYTRDLAEAFNAFYRECQVLGAEVAPEVRDARLALVVATRTTMAAALGVLGVAAPDSM